jgi:hypothetical protein
LHPHTHLDRLDTDFILDVGSFCSATKKHNFANNFGISSTPRQSKSMHVRSIVMRGTSLESASQVNHAREFSGDKENYDETIEWIIGPGLGASGSSSK